MSIVLFVANTLWLDQLEDMNVLGRSANNPSLENQALTGPSVGALSCFFAVSA